VTWTASPEATLYTVYRAPSLAALAKKTVLGTTSDTLFNDTTAVAGRTYYYWVRASNAYGTSSFSAYNAGKRSDGKPPAPTNISASDGTYVDRVEVTWAASSGATSYTVYRALSLAALAKKTAWVRHPTHCLMTQQPWRVEPIIIGLGHRMPMGRAASVLIMRENVRKEKELKTSN